MDKGPIQLAVLLLAVMLLLAGCQNRSSGDNAERRDGFYGGVIGGWTRP
jgi:uncharacterized lipoprotein NlpE involved in copper resistance